MKTTCARVPRIFSASRSTKASSSYHASTKRSSARPRSPLLEQAPVAGDRASRVVRREDEADDRVGAGGHGSVRRLGDPRLPVLHAGEDGEPELGLERGARPLGDRVQRVRVLDPEAPVAADEVVELLGRDRPPPADVRVVGRNVGDPLRRAVGHEDDCCAHARDGSRLASTANSASSGRKPSKRPHVALSGTPGPKTASSSRCGIALRPRPVRRFARGRARAGGRGRPDSSAGGRRDPG